MKRLFDRFEEAKERLRSSEEDLRRIDAGIAGVCRTSSGGPSHIHLFGGESLFAKTLKKTLTPEQVAAHDKNVYRSRVEWMVSLLDRALGLNAEQHRRFVALIVEETPPLKRYGNFDYDALLLQASRLPRGQIKPIFDDAQLPSSRSDSDRRGAWRRPSSRKDTSPRGPRTTSRPRRRKTPRSGRHRGIEPIEDCSSARGKPVGIDPKPPRGTHPADHLAAGGNSPASTFRSIRRLRYHGPSIPAARGKPAFSRG